MTKGRTLLGMLVLAGLVMLSAALEWVSAIGQGIMAQPVELSISGLQASPLTTASVLVVGTAVLAAAISSPIARRIALAIAGLGGIGVTIAPLLVGVQATTIAQSAAMSETSVNQLIGEPAVSPLRFIVVVLGLAVVALAVLGMRLSPEWAQSRTRYERIPSHAQATVAVADDAAEIDETATDPGDLIDLWDSQTAEAGHKAPTDPGTLD